MSQKILTTKLDKNGDLFFDKTIEKNNLKIITLYSDPFQWSDIIKKDTGNIDLNFVKKFIKDINIDFKSMTEVLSWYPFYYTAFLLELSNVIKELGIINLKNFLKDTKVKLLGRDCFTFDEDLLNMIPDDITNKTKIEKLSDIFNGFTNIEYMLITYS